MGSRRAIYNDIAPKPRFFFVRGKKIPESRAMPEGRRPEGTALPEGIFLPRTKKNRGWGGYIVVYSPTRPHIYNKYATFSLSQLSKQFSKTVLRSYLISISVIQKIRKIGKMRGLYMNFRISNLHYNIDQKRRPLYIALCTGHIYGSQGIYMTI